MPPVSKRSGRPRGSRTDPPRRVLLATIAEMVDGISAMIGKWFDSIPADVRADLTRIRKPGEDALIRAGVRGAQGTEK